MSYLKGFGEQAYFVNFPSKFISPDGKTLWMCSSAQLEQVEQAQPARIPIFPLSA